MAKMRLAGLIVLAFWLLDLQPCAQAGTFPDAHDPPTPGWTGPVFRLRQDYPTTPPPAETLPWKSFDFRTQPVEYLLAVRNYAYEGNIEVDWQVERNTVRNWYHAPWMHAGTNGREFVHGLTGERSSRPRELHPNQTRQFQNWAVSIYNAPGSFTIGRVWRNSNSPDPTAATFADGTVAVKLLFTTAPTTQVPYLRNAFPWQAHIHRTLTSTQRTIQTLRLLQMDVAVRDSRADATTGWVFGTFVYDADASGDTPWKRMVPLGLMWGNDPTVTPGTGTIRETVINPTARRPQHLGWASRPNGPVDNSGSSCLSCHSTAQFQAVSPVVPAASLTNAQKLRWFRNIRADEPFDSGQRSLGYSLQLGVGIQNFFDANPAATPPTGQRIHRLDRGGS